VHKYVLDASALLALLNAETGGDLVLSLLPKAVISTVNLAEVVTRLAVTGMPEQKIRETLSLFGLEAIPFSEEQAFLAGMIYLQTKSLGLSLGDRACLALAQATDATAVTADRAWGDLSLAVGVKVIC
jgi:PIN domain nuclease of toxin-antitoxin system